LKEKKGKGKKRLASLLTTYNLLHTVNFATRIQNNSSNASDNIFVNNSRIYLSSVSPTINGYQTTMLKFPQLKIYMQQ
jgi:hypothetical protein